MMWMYEPTLTRCIRERERNFEPERRTKRWTVTVDWSTGKVEHGKLIVSLEPAPDFAFMVEFDGIVDPLGHPRHEGWGGVRPCPWPRCRQRLRLESVRSSAPSRMKQSRATGSR